MIDEQEIDFDQSKPIDSALDYERSLAHAKMSSLQFLEVTEKLMKKLLKGQPSPYFIDQGVKIYIAGTREKIEKEESLTWEQKMALMKKEQEKPA